MDTTWLILSLIRDNCMISLYCYYYFIIYYITFLYDILFIMKSYFYISLPLCNVMINTSGGTLKSGSLSWPAPPLDEGAG